MQHVNSVNELFHGLTILTRVMLLYLYQYWRKKSGTDEAKSKLNHWS